MKNYIQEGCVLPYTIPSATTIASGDLVIVGDLAGVAASSGTENEVISVNLEGVFELPKVVGALTQGQLVYELNGDVTSDSDTGANPLVGWAFQAAESGDATAYVKLKQS